MEIKPKESCRNEEYARDYEKSVVATLTTVCCLADVEVKDVPIPFVIGHGTKAALFCSLMPSGQNVPRVYTILSKAMITKGPPRYKLFAFLVFCMEKVLRELHGDSETGEDKMSAYANRFANDPPDESRMFSKTNGNGSKKRKSDINSKTSGGGNDENAAKLAICNTGLFSHVEFPWVRIPRMFPKDGQSETSYQRKFPFYFKGRHTGSDQLVFLKVWSGEEFRLAEEEWTHLKTVEECGVPVSRLVEKELVQTNGDSGSYIIMAIELLEGDSIQQESALDYATSLIGAVDMLHEKAGMLHCDIKPDNVIFSGQIAKLIDFGHAQSEANATSYEATEGFEAPEVGNGTPHSRLSDAYSIGKTLLAILRKTETEHPAVKHVAEMLSRSESSERVSLKKALDILEAKRQQQQDAYDSPTSGSPPTKVPRLVSPTANERRMN